MTKNTKNTFFTQERKLVHSHTSCTNLSHLHYFYELRKAIKYQNHTSNKTSGQYKVKNVWKFNSSQYFPHKIAKLDAKTFPLYIFNSIINPLFNTFTIWSLPRYITNPFRLSKTFSRISLVQDWPRGHFEVHRSRARYDNRPFCRRARLRLRRRLLHARRNGIVRALPRARVYGNEIAPWIYGSRWFGLRRGQAFVPSGHWCRVSQQPWERHHQWPCGIDDQVCRGFAGML